MNQKSPLAGLLPALWLLSLPAQAAQHLMKISEVYTGPSTEPDAQYIELQMYAGGQNFVAGHAVTVYDATDTIVGTYTFSGNVGNGANQATILIATAAAQTRFGVTADLSMSPDITPSGGKVCFESFDCFAWGDYLGDSQNPDSTGNPFNPGSGLAADRAARRDISGGTNGNQLDAADDSGDSATDFAFAASPAPTNNAGETGSAGGGGGGGGSSGGGGSGGGSTGGGGGSGAAGPLLLLLAGLSRRRRRA